MQTGFLIHHDVFSVMYICIGNAHSTIAQIIRGFVCCLGWLLLRHKVNKSIMCLLRVLVLPSPFLLDTATSGQVDKRRDGM